MKTSTLAAFCVLGMLFLSGCASVLQVTYVSDPPGAMLYENGRQWGYAPMTLQYPPSQSFKQGGCMILQPAMVRWASGAEASIEQLQACGNIGYVQQFIFLRPKEIPGRELDVQFSLELQQIAVQQAMAQAQRDAAAIQLFNVLNQQNQQALQRNQTIHCTSEAVRGTIYTDCR